MPITLDIKDHKVLGPAIRKCIDQGRPEGWLEEWFQGWLEGRQLGATRMLTLLLEKRFGPLPKPIEARLASCSVAEIENLGLRLLDAQTLDDLFA